MSKQFRVDCPFGNGAAIHCNILSMLPTAILMNDLRKALLSHPAFPGYQYGQISGSNLDGYINGARQSLRITNNTEPEFYLLNLRFRHNCTINSFSNFIYTSSSTVSSFSLSLSSRFS